MSRQLVIVMAVAVVVRGIMLLDFLSGHPGAYVVQGDALAYWTMAGNIAAGELVGREPYLSAPLYAYFLAMVRAVGGGVLAVYVLQLVLHVLTAGLLGRLVAKRVDERAGMLAAILFLLLMEPAFYVTRVLPTTLQLLLVVAVMLAAEASGHMRSLGAYAALGVALGALALIYPTAIVLVIVLPVWVWWTEFRAVSVDGVGDGSPQRIDVAWEKAVIAVVSGAAIIAPATLHNWAACGEFIPITAHGGITLLQGNSPEADGIYTPVPGISQTREKMHADALALFQSATGSPGDYGEVDRFFREQAWRNVVTDKGHAAWLVWRKLCWFLTGRHYSDIDYPTLEQKDGWLRLLVLAPVHTAWLMGPALLGMIVGRRGLRINVWDVLLVILPLATVCVFWYSPRYRAPALPMLVVFAVIAARRAGLWSSAREVASNGADPRGCRIALAAMLLVGMLTGLLNWWSGFDRAEAYRPQYEFNRGQVYVNRQEFEQASVHFEIADRLAPDRPYVLAALVDANARTGRMAQAEQVARRLTQIDPEAVQSWLTLGGLYLREEQWERAAEAFQQAVEVSAGDAHAHVGLALALSHDPQRAQETEEHFRAAIAIDSNHMLAVCEAGRWLFGQGRRAEALALLERCMRGAPERRDIAAMLAEAAGEAPSAEDRIRELRAAILARSDNPELYSRLAGLLFQMGAVEDAIEVLRDGASKARENETLLLELAWVLATSPPEMLQPGSDVAALRQEAVTFAERAVQATSEVGSESMDVLAAAYASVGRFEDAVTTSRRAYNMAVAQGNEPLAVSIRERMRRYESGRAYVRE